MKKVIATLTAALAMLIGFSPAAQAGNGTSNFYLAASCWPGGSTGARLSVTNWDLNQVGQQYHIDLNSDKSTTNPIRIGVLQQRSIYFDGVLLSGTEGVYKRTSGWGRHRIVGYWKNIYTNSLVSCTITL